MYSQVLINNEANMFYSASVHVVREMKTLVISVLTRLLEVNHSFFFLKSKPNLTLTKIICFCFFLSTEGLAVGVGFGAIGKTSSATFERAR